MGVRQEMNAIMADIKLIDESKARISVHLKELNRNNPFSIGEILIGNDDRHTGKEFVVDKTYVGVGRYNIKNAEHNLGQVPKYFMAEGVVLKKNRVHSMYRTTRYVTIGENHGN